MQKDASRRGARGWLGHDHTYRRRIVDEIQKRADYPIRERARVTRLMMAGETVTDYFRRKLLESVDGSLPGNEDAIRDRLKQLIEELAPDSDRHRVDDKYEQLAAAIRKVTDRETPIQKSFKEQVTAQFNILKQAFERPPLHRPAARFDDGRDPELAQMPFRNGGARGKYWLDFTPLVDPTGSYDVRLRVHRESYPSNETLNILEDFASLSDTGLEPVLVETEEGPAINTEAVGVDRFDALLEQHSTTLGRYEWVGSLLSVSHFWILPAEEVLVELSTDTFEAAKAELRQQRTANTRNTQALFQSAAKFARRSFPHRDSTCDFAERSDHVLTVLGDGELILIADFQAHSRTSAPGERAVRYVLLNLGASEDKLGRIMMKLNDIEAYRIVALRDFQFTFPVTDVIDACNAHIAIAENDAARDYKFDASPIRRRNRMRKLLSEITDLSARITAANHFIESGLVGLADRGLEMKRLMQSRLKDLNERPVLGYQSLSGYIRRVDNSINSMQRSKSRYLRARERIDEIINLARAELDQLGTDETNRGSYYLLVLTAVVVLIEMVPWLLREDGTLLGQAAGAAIVAVLAGVLAQRLTR